MGQLTARRLRLRQDCEAGVVLPLRTIDHTHDDAPASASRNFESLRPEMGSFESARPAPSYPSPLSGCGWAPSKPPQDAQSIAAQGAQGQGAQTLTRRQGHVASGQGAQTQGAQGQGAQTLDRWP